MLLRTHLWLHLATAVLESSMQLQQGSPSRCESNLRSAAAHGAAKFSLCRLNCAVQCNSYESRRFQMGRLQAA